MGAWQVIYREVFPTHVGMDRIEPAIDAGQVRIPHARGDGPGESIFLRCRMRYSPRTWGWTDDLSMLAKKMPVFPTHVGMDRSR